MMVLRHLGPPSSATMTGHHPDRITSHREEEEDDDRGSIPIPIDLSNKRHHHRHHISSSTSSSSSSPSPEIPKHQRDNHYYPHNHHHHHHTNRKPLLRPPLSSPSSNNNNNNNNNNEEDDHHLKCNNVEAEEDMRVSSWKHLRRKENNLLGGWREREDETMILTSSQHSSPDSGLYRDSPGEEERDESGSGTPPPPSSIRGNKQLPLLPPPHTLIPLSIIKARYSHHPHHSHRSHHHLHNHHGGEGEEEGEKGERDDLPPSPRNGGKPPDKLLTKRARLEEMVTHIKKSTKDRSRRNSGDDSSGGHATSSDEIEGGGKEMGGGNLGSLEDLRRKPISLRDEVEDGDDQPYNLVCNSNKERDLWAARMSRNQSSPPKIGDPLSLSPTDAAKLLGMDPETYQQQLMQLQLTSAALAGDPTNLLKGYPPWVYLGYYSQMLQSFQAQEILRQYALQTNTHLAPNTPPLHNSQGERSPSISKTSARYNCPSPLSPASFGEGGGHIAGDSDGSTVGPGSTPGSANSNGNGKRAPRAMTGRHVRTGTGASPTTLQTLRQKIEERQRMKAQQAREEQQMLNQLTSNSKLKPNSNNKFGTGKSSTISSSKGSGKK